MSVGNVVVALNLTLNVLAALCYGWDRQWNLAVYWAAAAVLVGAVLWRSW